MNSVFKLKTVALGALLLAVSMSSGALTLGRARGAALIAQPLNLSISVTAAADEDVSEVCFEADVFYGENKVEGSRVTLTSDKPVAGQTWQVRIASRLPVDEPVVTVYLRSTCVSKSSRRFVLLADVASDAAPLNALTSLPQVPVVPARVEPLAARPAAEASAVSAAATPGTKSTSGAAKPAAKRSTQLPTSPVEKAEKRKPRLKLAPIDLSVERDLALRASPELLSAPVEDSQKRLEAAALWRALNLSPEDVLKDAARLQAMESDIQKLNGAAGANQRQLQELLGRITQAESERYHNPVVYGLGGLVLLLIGGGAWFISRQSRNSSAEGTWWRADGVGEAVDQRAPSDPLLGSTVALDQPVFNPDATTPNVVVKPGHVNQSAGHQGVDIDLDLDLSAGYEQSAASPAAKMASAFGSHDEERHSRPTGMRDFSPSMSGSLRAVNTQEMIDVRQQAEFFMTLGQYDEAISLLEGHASDSLDLNPLVYLDLLRIFHTLSRKEQFDRYRDEFNAVFTGQVPEYAAFLRQGGSLENYPEFCEHLVSLWPSREGLEFIESYLVQKPDGPAMVRFDLDVFKDLLLLHAVCKRLVNALDGSPASFSATRPPARVADGFHTGASPISVEAPDAGGLGTEVDFELDISEATPSMNVGEANNLIDFDLPSSFADKPPR
jgi:hypothetical protein